MSTYDQYATIHAMRDLYQVVMRMADLPPSILTTPPPDWSPPPGTRKSQAVFELMANLPYINDASKEVHLAPQTTAINYLRPNWIGMFIPFDPYGIATPEEDFRRADINEDEMALTMQNDNVGRILILSTRTSLAREFSDTMSRPKCAVHENVAHCPQLCRHSLLPRNNRPKPILDILREWRQNYVDLKWMVDTSGPPDIVEDNDDVRDDDDEERLGKMRDVYRDRGWFGPRFRAGQCRAALAELRDTEDNDADSDTGASDEKD